MRGQRRTIAGIRRKRKPAWSSGKTRRIKLDGGFRVRARQRQRHETGDTHLADYLGTARARSLVCRSAGLAWGCSGRLAATVGRTCSTRSTPRGRSGRTPAASPDPSSWSSPCIARTSPRRSSRSRSGSRAWGRVWSTSATASRRMPYTRGTPRDNSSRRLASRTCRRWCGRSRRRSSRGGRTPSSRIRTALREEAPVYASKVRNLEIVTEPNFIPRKLKGGAVVRIDTRSALLSAARGCVSFDVNFIFFWLDNFIL